MPSTTLPTAAVQAFADAVRAALSDLPVDEVEDLTDGLEADLTERFEDTGTDFGDPIVYADELRGAAGLPPRGTRRHTSAFGILRTAVLDAGGAFRGLYDHPVTRRIVDFLVSLRPVWWLFRALVGYFLLALLFRLSPTEINPLTFCVAAGAVILSVQFGRGKWLPKRWMRRLLVVANVLLVLTVPFILVGLSAIFGAGYGSAYASGRSDAVSSQHGLYEGDQQVTNIFAYDANGQPLTDVQLYDQHGNPLVTTDDTAATFSFTGNFVYLPNHEVIGRQGWNIYPLLQVPYDVNTGLPVADATPSVPHHKYATVPPLANQSAPSPSATATPTPSPIPTP
jgi:hypothetical protein